MGKYDSLIFEVPSARCESVILEQAQKPLELFRNRQQRMNFLKWFTVPVLTSIVGLVYFRNQSTLHPTPESSDETALLALLPVEELESLELIAELDFIENLEDLENWEES